LGATLDQKRKLGVMETYRAWRRCSQTPGEYVFVGQRASSGRGQYRTDVVEARSSEAFQGAKLEQTHGERRALARPNGGESLRIRRSTLCADSLALSGAVRAAHAK